MNERLADALRELACWQPVTTSGLGSLHPQHREAVLAARAALAEGAGTLDAKDEAIRNLRTAHKEHLRTGDYTRLGMAAQDILLALDAALAAPATEEPT